jgi:hypothetical protein
VIRKSITTGAIVGLLLTLAALYPIFSILVTRVTPLWLFRSNPQLGDLIHPVLLMASAGAATLIFLLLGSFAAWRARARTFATGLVAGMISGAVVGLVLYITLVAPTATVLAGADVLKASLPSGSDHLPETMTVAFVQQVLVGGVNNFWLTLLAAVMVGGLEGGLVGWLQRHASLASHSLALLDVMGDRHGHRVWFEEGRDEAVRAGLLAGLGGGAILILSTVSVLTNAPGSTSQETWMGQVFRQALAGTPLSHLTSNTLLALLSPLAFVTVIGVGGLAAALPRNPSSRLGARIYAAMVAGTLVGLLVSIPIADQLRIPIGLAPEYLPPTPPSASAEAAARIQFLTTALSAPPMRVLLIYVLPILMTWLAMMGWTIWAMLQGVFYGLILMLFRLRPVDRARMVRRDMARHDDQFLPRLYQLFQNDRHAMLVLEHLAFDLRADPVKARIVAAYHTLAMQPQRAAEALDTIARALNEQHDWKLQVEVAALHGLIAQGLRATTVAQVAVIAPMPEQQTTPLPPLLAKAGNHLTRILNELKKVERVDDLNAKIIFLNNTLEALRLAQIFSTEGVTGGSQCGAVLPEFCAVRALLDQWEAVVMSEVKNLQGRAELVAELKTRKLTFAPRLTLTVTLFNRGLNVAEDIHFLIDDGEEYTVLDGNRQSLDILTPQGNREVSFTIQPRSVGRRLRVSWKVTYDDAFNDDRLLEFGDQIEFVEAEIPFQRIFPIPYVTGTPLQSGQMFVGRQDVFDFVREHLLGAYQNNVIVLHGQRRTGKTSILYRLNEVLADTHVCVLIDMQGKAARGEVDFLYSMADDIAYALENKGITVELPARQEFAESPEFFFRSRFLRGVGDALGDRNLLIMFDEFEELQKRVEDGKLTADIFPYLRNLMQHERKVDFVFAGTHKLEELGAEYWSILFNIAAYKKITFLTADEVTRLVTLPVAPFGLEYDPLAIERIYQVAAGHPYFTQVICHELVTYHNETQRNYLTTTEVDAALGRILERGEAHFKYIWAESSVSQRLALLALAELLESDEAATLDDVAAVLRKRGRPLDGRELPQALDDLEARDILMRSGPRSSLYRFRVDLIRRWIYATRPAYEKVA